MPQVTVYIREGDMPAWRAIDKKSQFMHDVLQDTADVKYEPIKETAPPAAPLKAEPAPAIEVMDNDALKELLGRKAKPIKDEPRHHCKENCRHWVWQTDSAQYVNSLTGETRDAPDF